MKKILALLALALVPSLSWAWSFGSGGSVDYSRDAANTFYCANVAGTPVTTAAGLSATNPVLFLANPSGSGKNLTLLDVGINITASPAAAAGFMLAYSTGAVNSIVSYSTNVVVIPALIPAVAASTLTAIGFNSSNAVAKCGGGIGAVLVNAPYAFRYLGGTTGAAAISGFLQTDLTQGKVVIPPGSTISIQTKTAASVSADFLWREDNL